MFFLKKKKKKGQGVGLPFWFLVVYLQSNYNKQICHEKV